MRPTPSPDSRVLAATGVASDKPAIAERAERWEFSLASEADRRQQAKVRAAAEHLEQHERGLSPTERAVRAIEITSS